MSPLARSLLALATAALLHGACARHSRHAAGRRSSQPMAITLGNITEIDDIIELPVLHIGVPDAVVELPNDCDPHGYLARRLVGTVVIVGNSDNSGAPPEVAAVDISDPQSDLVVHCIDESVGDALIVRCPQGVDVYSYQYCEQLDM